MLKLADKTIISLSRAIVSVLLYVVTFHLANFANYSYFVILLVFLSFTLDYNNIIGVFTND